MQEEHTFGSEPGDIDYVPPTMTRGGAAILSLDWIRTRLSRPITYAEYAQAAREIQDYLGVVHVSDAGPRSTQELAANKP